MRGWRDLCVGGGAEVLTKGNWKSMLRGRLGSGEAEGGLVWEGRGSSSIVKFFVVVYVTANAFDSLTGCIAIRDPIEWNC